MTIRSGTATLASISLGSAICAGFIIFVVFPWAETTSDPDRIEAPAWVLVLFLTMMAIVFGVTTLIFALAGKTNRI
jgi:hypothetical protein